MSKEEKNVELTSVCIVKSGNDVRVVWLLNRRMLISTNALLKI